MSAAYLGQVTGRLRGFHLCGLAKIKRKPRYRITPVARYVSQRHAAVARALHSCLQEWARKIAKEVRAAGERVSRAAKPISPADQIMRDVIESMDLEAMSQDVVDELYPVMKKTFRIAGTKSSQKIIRVVPKDLVQQLDARALAYAKKRAAELVGKTGGPWSISGATRSGLRKIVERGVKEGLSSDEVAKEIMDSYPFSPGRAETIARTELAYAHVRGNVEGWKVTGLVDRKRSILGDLHEHEDECDQNAEAGAIDIDDVWPSGDAHPPYHPNCVCDEVPVLKGED